MKNLVECISESLLKENSNDIAVVINHSLPNDTFIILNCDANIKKLNKMDVTFKVVSRKPADKLIFISDTEKSVFAVGVPDVNKLKNICWDEYEFDHEYPEFDTVGIGMIDMSDEDEKRNANDLWKYLTNMIEKSEADGDSGYVYALVDPAKQDVIVKGRTNIHFYDDVTSFLSVNDLDSDSNDTVAAAPNQTFSKKYAKLCVSIIHQYMNGEKQVVTDDDADEVKGCAYILKNCEVPIPEYEKETEWAVNKAREIYAKENG